jgi:hypothetical protein
LQKTRENILICCGKLRKGFKADFIKKVKNIPKNRYFIKNKKTYIPKNRYKTMKINNKHEDEEVFSELLKKKSITKLNDLEKENYLKFFENTYLDNLNAARYNLDKFPRWSIIAGYYAMHDITKLFLAKKYRLKINNRVHFACIISLSFLLNRDKQEFVKTVEFLKNAQKIFDENVLGIKIDEIAQYLKKGKSERGKIQYYNPEIDKNVSEKAAYFINNLVVPFIKLLEVLI